MTALGSKGFRPFFLGAAAFAVVAVPLWIGMLVGGPLPRGPLSAVTWHAHEMIFGFTAAVIAGFLLTAVENWTGRPTVRGLPLLGLAALWLGARVAMWSPGWLGPALDLAFLPLVALAIARPLWAAGNRRNLPFVWLLGALWATDVAVYADAADLWPGVAATAHRMAVHGIAVIILVVAGRVVPMFTRNATGDARVQGRPALDATAVAATVALALLQPWARSGWVQGLAALAGFAVLARMAPWWSPGVLMRPLLWVLHLGHATVGLGLLASALPLLGVSVGSSPLHLVTVGGIGLLTLGMMARVSLGHTGRALEVGPEMAVAFCAIAAATGARFIVPWMSPTAALRWYAAAAALWSIGFLCFVVLYTPVLLAPRADGRPG